MKSITFILKGFLLISMTFNAKTLIISQNLIKYSIQKCSNTLKIIESLDTRGVLDSQITTSTTDRSRTAAVVTVNPSTVASRGWRTIE